MTNAVGLAGDVIKRDPLLLFCAADAGFRQLNVADAGGKIASQSARPQRHGAGNSPSRPDRDWCERRYLATSFHCAAIVGADINVGIEAPDRSACRPRFASSSDADRRSPNRRCRRFAASSDRRGARASPRSRRWRRPRRSPILRASARCRRHRPHSVCRLHRHARESRSSAAVTTRRIGPSRPSIM